MTRAALLRDFAGISIAVLAAALLATAEPTPLTAPPAVLAAVAVLGVWIAWQDLVDFTIPDGAVAGLALVGLTQRLVVGAAIGIPATETLALVGFDLVLGGGGLLAVREFYFRRRGFDGLGMGDVKLGGAGAILLGSTGLAVALGLASVAALLVALARRPAGAPLGGIKIAFGAAFGPAIALTFVAAAAGFLPGPSG